MTATPDIREDLEAPDPIDCYAAMRKLWDYLDDELTSKKMAMIQMHLGNCAACHGHHQFAREFLAELERVQTEMRARARLRRRIVSVLRAEGFRPRNGDES